MGAGIAQVAALASHPVALYDVREGAAAQSAQNLRQTLESLVAKGKLAADLARAAAVRITPIAALKEAASATLVVEAVVEQIDVKRDLFRQLEEILPAEAVLATNTSSISITAIANGMRRPGRVVGMHFFNPVPLMKLVEVVSGLQTDPAVAEAVFVLAQDWGKTPVHAKSTPGFIVNRIARPFYAETLALLQEQAAEPAVLDACLRAAGFRMGPCELMDLIGHDTNFSVTRSVYEANFFDKRYVPSLVQRELVDGGWLGRKSGRGFYVYPEGRPALPALAVREIAQAGWVTTHGQGAIADRLEHSLANSAAQHTHRLGRERASDWIGLDVDGARLVMTDGTPAYELAARWGVTDVAIFDHPLHADAASAAALAYAMNAAASESWRSQAPAWLHLLGFAPVELADAPGLVVARTVAMLVNEAADAVLQGVCSEAGADAAMKLGVNYPAGPFEWLRHFGVSGIVRILEALDRVYRGERYRVSPWLSRRGTS
jgi:3-hydroxybutyryl-CoA dehydrogenase